MTLLQPIADRLVGWLALVVAALVPGVVATALWSPFLIARRIRALFASLPPEGTLLGTYALVGVAASTPYVVGVGGVLAFVDPGGVAWSNALLFVALLPSVAYAVAIPTVAILGLPCAGLDWDPAGYGPTTWVLLVAGAVWYAALFAIPIAAVGVALALPGGY